MEERVKEGEKVRGQEPTEEQSSKDTSWSLGKNST